MDKYFASFYDFASPKRPRKMSAVAGQSTSTEGLNDSSGDDKGDSNPSLEIIQDDKLFVERFSILYNNEMFSDIILRVGDERYFAHKFMLITCSEVFEVMLNEERWRESSQPEISLTEEVECVPVFGDFLRYIYTGSVGLTTDHVLPILLLADKYSIPLLQKSCAEYMMRHIVESPDTNRTLSWYQYSKMTGNSLLSEKCLKFIESNFDIVLKTSDWVELTKDEIVEFLTGSDSVVSSEFDLWIQLEKWLLSENNQDRLLENLRDIIPLLRFTNIPPKNLLEIEQSELARNHPNIFLEKLNAAYRHHSLLFDEVDLKPCVEKYRNYTSEMYGLCNDLSLLNYVSVEKIVSKIGRRFQVPHSFVPSTKTLRKKQSTTFDVTFWPKGHYTTFTLYGNHMGRQTDNTTLMIRRVTGNEILPPMETTITFIIFGVKNGVRYVAFTYTKSFTFSDKVSFMSEDNVIALKWLLAEGSPYLVNGNLDAKLFIKIQNILDTSNENV